MADVVTLASLGKIRTYCEQVNAETGVLLGVLLQDAQEADATLRDRLTLADVLSNGSSEANWSGGTAYARKEWTVVTLNTAGDQATNDRVDFSVTDPTWESAGSGGSPQSLGKLGICYAPATGATNSNTIPLVWLDYPEVATGSDLVITMAAQGFYRESAA
ncbi:MAG: hypothetical protein L0I76_35605 [Pseudonocardia sp.]|nr:hypothetical protein [Pseudonocardia sp.]